MNTMQEIIDHFSDLIETVELGLDKPSKNDYILCNNSEKFLEIANTLPRIISFVKDFADDNNKLEDMQILKIIDSSSIYQEELKVSSNGKYDIDFYKFSDPRSDNNDYLKKAIKPILKEDYKSVFNTGIYYTHEFVSYDICKMSDRKDNIVDAIMELPDLGTSDSVCVVKCLHSIEDIEKELKKINYEFTKR